MRFVTSAPRERPIRILTVGREGGGHGSGTSPGHTPLMTRIQRAVSMHCTARYCAASSSISSISSARQGRFVSRRIFRVPAGSTDPSTCNPSNGPAQAPPISAQYLRHGSAWPPNLFARQRTLSRVHPIVKRHLGTGRETTDLNWQQSGICGSLVWEVQFRWCSGDH
jgi:hypothetical protein